MKLICGWAARSTHPSAPPCGKPAVILIITGIADGLATYPVCADHAPEEVHEAKGSMDEDEFVIVDLTATAKVEAVWSLVAAPGMTVNHEIINAMTLAANKVREGVS